MRTSPNLVFVVLLSLCMGCASRSRSMAFVPIRHVVIVDLKDDNDYREFGADCFQFTQIPGIINVLTGPGLTTGQAEAMPCGAGLVLDVENPDACRKLKDHPAYANLLNKWTPRARSIRVASFGPRCEEPAETPSSASRTP